MLRTRRIVLALCLALVMGACRPDAPPGADAAGAAALYASYGTAFAPEGAVPVQAVAAEPDGYLGQPVKVEGTVREVCQMKGCWLTLDAGTDVPVRVEVARTEGGDYAFTVPKDLSGRRVVVQGTMKRTVLDADAQRHLAEDAGRPAGAETLQPRDALTLTAQGVLVEKG